MKVRLIAWAVLALILYGIWVAGSSWQNPWRPGGLLSLTSPVLSHLPPSPDGCREKGCDK